VISRRQAVSVTAALALAACNREGSPPPQRPPTAFPIVGVEPPDSATILEANGALVAFLDASREGSPTRDALPSLTNCPGGGAPAPGPMLARYLLLPGSLRADTIVGRALVTTVAEQDVDRQHPGHFVARVRIRSDTLEWDLLRTKSGFWTVCNGLRFGLTAPDSLTTWRPTGASIASARALADSIAALR
jgi:hypothetical protein